MFSLEQKIGQLLIVGLLGTGPQHDFVKTIAPQIQKGYIGGVILFTYNIESASQIADFTKYLHALSSEYLWMSLDQEGGKVQRLRKINGFETFPSFKELGTLSPEDVFRKTLHLATVVKQAGCNMNFTPCVDLDLGSPVISGYDRSLGRDVKGVVQRATEIIKAHQQLGIVTVLKHYPGHGSAPGDTHEDMIDVTKTYQDIEMQPFQDLIRQGCVDMVMTSHIFHRTWDPHMPATMSSVILRKLRDMGFAGVIVSDDLHMGAIQKKFRKKGHEHDYTAEGFDLKAAVIQALKAGVDVIIVGNNPNASVGIEGFQSDPNIAEKIIAYVKEAIAEGHLIEQDIEDKWQRVRKLKNMRKVS